MACTGTMPSQPFYVTVLMHAQLSHGAFQLALNSRRMARACARCSRASAHLGSSSRTLLQLAVAAPYCMHLSIP